MAFQRMHQQQVGRGYDDTGYELQLQHIRDESSPLCVQVCVDSSSAGLPASSGHQPACSADMFGMVKRAPLLRSGVRAAHQGI